VDQVSCDTAPLPLDESAMAALAERLESLPMEHAEWVLQLFLECRRARESEARLKPGGCPSLDPTDPAEIAHLVLDAADWLRTLWDVGYMGSEALPARPRTDFPQVNVEDILKSALFSRIRHGKRPLPFPPPTRNGVPWHEIVESEEPFTVGAAVADDGLCVIEECTDWQVMTTETTGRTYRVQHRGKGPIYQLTLDRPDGGVLRKCPAETKRRMVRQMRIGMVVYLLEWPKPDGNITQVPLRAVSWERAEAEALRWVALRHPDLYGQIHFERCEA
jgi:hypothetical protein